MKLVTKIISFGLVSFLLLCGCNNNDRYTASQDNNDFFNFATSEKCKMDITYDIPEGYNVFFEVYAENPFITDAQGLQVKKTDIKPIMQGFTDTKGKFAHNITIPTYVEEVYVYSPSMGVPVLLSGTVTAKNISVSSLNYTAPQIPTRAKASHQTVYNDFKPIGSWEESGRPEYLAKPVEINGDILQAINEVFKDKKSIDKAYFQKTDLNITKETKLTLTFLSEKTNIDNVLGYFCYDTDKKPQSAEEIKDKIVAFPRAKQGTLKCGNTIQLKYWKDGEDKGEIFPAGTSIGWILCIDGYGHKNKQGISNGEGLLYSIPEFNPEKNGEKNYIAYVQKDNFICFGFEDGFNKADGDCNDVICHIASSTADAIGGFPEAPGATEDPEEVAYITEYTGTLAFEDVWPYKGDYDMNDVVIRYSSVVSFNNLNEAIGSEDTFQLLWAGAQFEDAFGYQLETDRNNVTVEIRSEGYTSPLSGLDLTLSKATIMLFDNAVAATADNTVQPAFIVNTKYKNRVKIDDFTPAPYNPFIVVKDEYNRSEIHLCNYMPTEKADQSLFGSGDDLSNPAKGIYYVSENHFPFAINIVGEDEYQIPDETIRIDKYYPKFNDWAISKGEKNKDWYKHPEK